MWIKKLDFAEKVELRRAKSNFWVADALRDSRSSTLPKKSSFEEQSRASRSKVGLHRITRGEPLVARLCMIAGRAPLFELRLLACHVRQLRPGDPVAPAVYRLWLLPSGPDQIHSSAPHRTQPSTLLDQTVTATVAPSEWEFSPAIADCGLQGTASAPLSTTEVSILHCVCESKLWRMADS